MTTIKAIETITWENGKIKLIDQTKLPTDYVEIYCTKLEEIWQAIKELKVRGAPALGLAAAYGAYLGIKDFDCDDFEGFYNKLEEVTRYLSTSRPTAVNLFWGLERMKRVANKNSERPILEIKGLLLKEAEAIRDEDDELCRSIALHGEKLIKDGDTVLTHCNAGGLATSGYGTALGVLYAAKEKGKNVEVYADETRPLLQGARLSTWELMHMGIKVTLICDNMAASLMKAGKIDKVIVGADRIARNGDTANKIGTYNVAVLADYHKIPFYVAAPSSSFDFSIKDGNDIPIEQRNPKEITEGLGRRIAPHGINVYNPAFDVTPHKLISAIITEKGVFQAPYTKSLKKLTK